MAERRAEAAEQRDEPVLDQGYRFDDLDEFVRNAQVRGLEVLMTIWGTPKWANKNKGPKYLPTKPADFQNFARALASRYSGRYAGYPFVRFYGIWNESNLGNFLAPQFNSAGKIVSPANYAKIAAAGYAGIKAGSPKALVAIGETSSSGRDVKKKGATDSTRPGTFAKLLAQANKKLKFDAWAQHPYPVPVNQGPNQKVRYPNVTFSTMAQFEKDLDKWFGRKNIPVWVTEYGNETKPGEPKGVTRPSRPSTCRRRSRTRRRTSASRCSSGSSSATRGRARGRAASTGRRRGQARGAEVEVGGEAGRPRQRQGVRQGRHGQPVRGRLSARVLREQPGRRAGRRLVADLPRQHARAERPERHSLAVDCTITVRLVGLRVTKGQTYRAQIDANTVTTAPLRRTITIVGT